MGFKSKPPVLFIMGPTASGKTDLAIALRQHLPVELINVDSAQIYRQLNIGAAKPDADILAMAPHRLLDIRDPSERYSVAEFLQDARAEIESITSSGRIPLLVGGSMMYFKVLLDGIADLPEADFAVREAIEAEAAMHGWPALHAQLAEVDPETAASIHPNHNVRICRALEVYRTTGITLSQHKLEQSSQPTPLSAYEVIQIGLLFEDRAILHDRIALRFQQMMQKGFASEVESLWQRGDLDDSLPAVRSAGYFQLWQHFSESEPLDDCVQKGIYATRQLAKRQLTWLRGWPQLNTIMVDKNGQMKPKQIIVEEALKIVTPMTI